MRGRWWQGEFTENRVLELIRNEPKYDVVGRIAFHANGGYTSIQFWLGGPQLREVKTESIPSDLREIGTWIRVRLPSFEVVGLGEPQDWPWDDEIPRGLPKNS